MILEAEKIKLGFIGGGPNSLIGQMHQIAAAMHDQYDLVGGIFGREFSTSISHARNIKISEDRVYSSLDALVEGEKCLPPSERMAVVAVLSPNSLHFEAAERLLVEGFHVICEKPMTTNLSDALALQKLVRETGRIFCVTHTYTGYPMVRQMRELIAQGLLGEIRHVDARYLQGWIAPVLKSTEMSAETWRLDPNIVGDSCCFGDIGVHAFNLVEYTTGISIEQLLADLHTGTESNSLDVDGTALFRSSSGVRGVIRASQIAAGEENNLAICVYGDKGALKWEQETQVSYFICQKELLASCIGPATCILEVLPQIQQNCRLGTLRACLMQWRISIQVRLMRSRLVKFGLAVFQRLMMV